MKLIFHYKITSNPHEYLTKPLHYPDVSVWFGFTTSFILGPFFCPVSGVENLYSHCTTDDAPTHFTREVKTFLLNTFNEDRVGQIDHDFLLMDLLILIMNFFYFAYQVHQ
ncbi:hypothetical protein CDAR_453451 [Caerostris darwini]|uniref:Uncharacterized protein n=1 Tax=Caerostris darwini TaxID=1538125 RepID=A0AAV4T7U6_9ARAC|nr:hypothetical protein CDAR_453451 [Caerostris darwini]